MARLGVARTMRPSRREASPNYPRVVVKHRRKPRRDIVRRARRSLLLLSFATAAGFLGLVASLAALIRMGGK